MNSKGRCIGNHPKGDRPYLERAIEDTGYDITISEFAIDVYGKPLPDDIALYTNESRDHGSFFRRFHELKEAGDALSDEDPEEVVGVEMEW